MQRKSDEELYQEILLTVGVLLYEEGSRLGNCAPAVAQNFGVPVPQARRVLAKLKSDGWMDTYWAHGEKHFKLRDNIVADAWWLGQTEH